MKKIFIVIFSFILFTFLYVFPSQLNAEGFVMKEEKINSYDSVIEVQKDRSLIIKETINVTARNIDINHGIYRDFPTKYKDSKGVSYIVGFDVVSIKRDGKNEPYSIESVSNGKRIYIGDKNTYLNPGDYTYEITYRTTKQLGLFSDHDELYFNAIGTGWVFPIVKSSATIILPVKLKDTDIQKTSFTGLEGSIENKATSRIDNSSSNTKVIFETTGELPASNGLTIVVGWPKGYINYPTAEELKFEEFLNNLYIYVGIFGIIMILLYYYFTWLKVGKDPAKGVVIPEYSISDNISPGIVSYINNMGFNNNALISNIVNLARKKVITINEHDDSFNMKLTENTITDTITEEEQMILDKISKSVGKQLTISNGYSSSIHSFVENYKSKIQAIGQKYVKNNLFVKFFGVFLSVSLILIISFLYGVNRDHEGIFPIVLGLEFLLFFFGVIPAVIINGIKKNGSNTSIIAKVIGGCSYFFILFIVISFLLGIFLTADFNSTLVILVLPLVILNVIFLLTLSSRTVEGASLQDKIEGLKMYIKTAETERLKFIYKTFDEAVQNYEKILPYAIALGLELEWTNKFNQVFEQFKEETGNIYMHPSWYLMS
ncbi:MAG: DUF2207 domain-containing protein, partial [bacterium]